MSVINQMLKDLDKRGTDAGSGTAVRSIPMQKKSSKAGWWIVLLLVLAALAGAWAWMQGDTPSVLSQPSPTAVHIANPSAQVSAMQTVAEPIAASVAPMPSAERTQTPLPSKSRRVSTPQASIASAHVEGAMKLALSSTLSSIETPSSRPEHKSAARKGRPRGQASERAMMSKETTPQQQAENAYEKAVRLIEAGRKSEAIAMLEEVLAEHPKHAAARQALVGMLLDAKQTDDAAQVLKQGVRIDPSQSGMAMILARIQVERGETTAALKTLQNSLPYTKNKADYQAFLAALLQREKRHAEAIDHYRAALRQVPGNGIWWMGYGISLQAVGRNAEARNAYLQAHQTQSMTPALRAFVAQRIAQLR